MTQPNPKTLKEWQEKFRRLYWETDEYKNREHGIWAYEKFISEMYTSAVEEMVAREIEIHEMTPSKFVGWNLARRAQLAKAKELLGNQDKK